MLLAIDIGNSNIVWGVFDGDQLVADWRISTDHAKTTDEYAILLLDLLRVKGIGPERVDGVILSSVVPPLTSLFEELAETYFHRLPLNVSADLETGLTIQYTNPREVGSDRIVNAAAAYRRYGGPLIIVDFGTATTFCAITADGESFWPTALVTMVRPFGTKCCTPCSGPKVGIPVSPSSSSAPSL